MVDHSADYSREYCPRCTSARLRSTMRIIICLFTTAALLASFLPSLGPVLDHHFAERQLEHTHLGQLIPSHTHPYEVIHTHSSDDRKAVPTVSTGLQVAGPQDQVGFFVSHDRLAQDLSPPAAVMMHLSTDGGSSTDMSLPFAAGGERASLHEAVIAPPKKPPKV